MSPAVTPEMVRLGTSLLQVEAFGKFISYQVAQDF
jgi:hypothetical protein